MHNGRFSRLRIKQIFDGKMDKDIFYSILKEGDHLYAKIDSMRVYCPTRTVYNFTARSPRIDMTKNKHLLAAIDPVIEECCARTRRDWNA